ncbi:MAG: NAD(P)/FAD-dependent oxidoreductase [Deltaproteobacteria bacterium]|nr:MAG: NAD(P)/FAD-dependent oxidoreductase [Deltaproteobacteria bacterium]
MSIPHDDVLIVGAGLSGLCAGALLTQRCPDVSFTILEGRPQIGGTWDLFRYPGVRSDSDMYTLGFSFFPWKEAQSIADADAILRYLHDTVEAFGLASHLRFEKRVEQASWSTEAQRWTVTVRDGATGEIETRTCGFLWGCTGYYRYDRAHTPEFAGRDDFEGTVLHPQFWPEDFDPAGKRIVVIGSGATAITLVPSLAGQCEHVTMLQRSPTYVFPWKREDAMATQLNRFLPAPVSHRILRFKNTAWATGFYLAARRFPNATRRYLLDEVRRQVGDVVDVDTHFTPRYDPWDERPCMVPECDLFEALRRGEASMVTDRIDRLTATGLRLQSGEELEADVIVTATGLELQVMGGARLVVDGEVIDPSKHLLYRGCMLGGVPNHAISLGYTNASWTLKCELVSQYVCRLLTHMEAAGYRVVRPEPDPDAEVEPLIDMQSGYIERARARIPKQGSRAPWRLAQNYFVDQLLLRFSRIEDGVLQFSEESPACPRSSTTTPFVASSSRVPPASSARPATAR